MNTSTEGHCTICKRTHTYVALKFSSSEEQYRALKTLLLDKVPVRLEHEIVGGTTIIGSVGLVKYFREAGLQFEEHCPRSLGGYKAY